MCRAIHCGSLLLLLLAAPGWAADPLRLTHGIASGDVTTTSAVIWARTSRDAQMSVEYTAVSAVRWPPTRHSGPLVDAAGDFTGKVVLDGLSPDTAYVYWVRFTATGDAVVSEAEQFRTAPPDDAVRPLGLVWWGDLAGQSYCRDPERGYAIFGQMARLAPDLAIAADRIGPPPARVQLDRPERARERPGGAA